MLRAFTLGQEIRDLLRDILKELRQARQEREGQ